MSLNKKSVVQQLLPKDKLQTKSFGQAFAPTNIALCKYWGKRDQELVLPVTDSLSISLDHLGATTRIEYATGKYDEIILNGREVARQEVFYLRLEEYLNLFRPTADTTFRISTKINIPVAAGLASSACGFAALVLSLDDFFGWKLEKTKLSILARLGSGSAARSLWHGFVQWHAGQQDDGMDSYAERLNADWQDLRIGLLVLNTTEKKISSRVAMQATVETCPFFKEWPAQVAEAINTTTTAIAARDIWSLGLTAEKNALAMHALMLATTPPVIYSQAETLQMMQQVWQARAEGLPLFFTQDAGPNLKLIFTADNTAKVQELFAKVEIVKPFAEVKEPINV